jgi:hypothetical protein
MRLGLEGAGEFQKLVDRYGLSTARVIADALVADLKRLIHTHRLVACCLAILMRDFNDVVSKLKRVPFPIDPYVYAHHQLIGLVAGKVIDELSPSPPVIAVTYDENSKSAELQESWLPFKEANPEWGVILGTLAPLDDRTNPCIQIADLIAHTTTDTFRTRQKDPSAGMASLQAWLPKLFKVVYVDKRYLRAILAGNARRLANHAKEGR